MRLLETSTLEVCDFSDNSIPPYAILSHVWEDEEITLEDLQSNADKSTIAWAKVKQFCALAKEDGYDYAWMDTCCIDRKSSADVSYAINSAHRWYANSGACYAYLSDVSASETDSAALGSEFRSSHWFTRSWTVLELLAPSNVVFIARDWKRRIASKNEIATVIAEVAGIPTEYVRKWDTWYSAFRVAQVISWFANRRTQREEDMAYSLMGLLDVNIDVHYEGGLHGAFRNLQLELIKKDYDESLFAWREDQSINSYNLCGLLASHPHSFATPVCRSVLFDPDRPLYEMTKKGLRISPLLLSATHAQNFGFFSTPPHQSTLEKLFIMPLNCSFEDEPNCPVALLLYKVMNEKLSIFQRVNSILLKLPPTVICDRTLFSRHEVCVKQGELFSPENDCNGLSGVEDDVKAISHLWMAT